MTSPAAFGGCFRCGRAHWLHHCPELQPTADKAEHERRIKLYLARFQNWLEGTGDIRWTPEQKARAISAENAMHKAETAKMTTSRRNS